MNYHPCLRKKNSGLRIATILANFRRHTFRRCRSTLTAKFFNFVPPELANQNDRKRESSCRTMWPSINKFEDDGTECLSCMKFDFSTFFTDFSKRRLLFGVG